MPTRNISRTQEQPALKMLRMQIEAGIDALARGEFTEVADADLDDRRLAAAMATPSVSFQLGLSISD
jgi:hypothetical protein